MSTQLPKLIDAAPDLINKTKTNLGNLNHQLHDLTSSGSSNTTQISPNKMLTYIFTNKQMLFHAAKNIVIMGMLSLFLLISLPRLVNGLYALIPHNRRPHIQMITKNLLKQINQFILTNVITSILTNITT